MNKKLTTSEQLSIETCKFILLQAKLHGWFISDKSMAADVISEMLEVQGPDGEAIERELLVN